MKNASNSVSIGIDGFSVTVERTGRPASGADYLVPGDWAAPASEDKAVTELEDLAAAEQEAEELLAVLAAAAQSVKSQHYEVLVRQAACRRLLTKPVSPPANGKKKGPGRPKKTVTADPVPATVPEALAVAAALNHGP